MAKQDYLLDITAAVKERFDHARSILSFSEYLENLQQHPAQYCRNSAQYTHDAFLHFGQTTLDEENPTQTRYNLFDNAEAKGIWVAGHEDVQQSILRMLGNFVREGQVTRLILLHGPNGSGKSSLINAIIEGLEAYSHTPEGALYRFHWIFPSEKKIKRTGIGFAREDDTPLDLPSFAHLEGDQIDARISSPMKDHPLLLLPQVERHRLFERLQEEGKLDADFPHSTYLLEGDLCPRNRMIFDALMAHYGGNYADVLRHIQVERYYVSRRYRQSVVTIEPQMHVDAVVRQVTADHSLSALPRPLANLSLFEPMGALIDANRGVLEYSDLLKRRLEAFKYLLGTCETGRINVDPIILYLDLLLLGSANEQNLDQFKESPEFTSFKSRIELIRVPYLLRYSVEQTIYDQQLEASSLPKPITPHLTQLAALWAILTRLKKPQTTRLPEEIADFAATFTPLEKAYLYNDGSIPKRFTGEQTKQIRQHLQAILEESRHDLHYEGRFGASPREIRSLLLNAAQNEKYTTVSPLALFEEMEKLVQERSVYRFLQLEPKDGYYDPSKYIEVIRQVHIDIINQEYRLATGLIQPDQYSQLLTRYVQHVKAFIQKEKVSNPITGKSEPPDNSLMENVEEVLLTEDEDKEKFRQGIIGRIAARKLDNPDEDINLPDLFSSYIDKLESSFFSKQYKRLQRILQHCLMLLVDEKSSMNDDDRKEAEDTLHNLETEYHYHRDDIRENLALLAGQFYKHDLL